ncbi:MAG: radical SAM protein [Bacillota bacterium]
MPQPTIDSLFSGGVITNYYCSSRCRHCLYGCSPSWPKEYIDMQKAEEIFQKISSLGCRSVHIGGGEPFLNPQSLLRVLEAARRAKVRIEYIETNSSWCTDETGCLNLLNDVKQRGVNALLLSISPFHNEYIPFIKVKRVMEACRGAGLVILPWVDGFIPEISSFDENRTHGLKEFCREYGGDYLLRILPRYWVTMRGRALLTYRDLLPRTDLKGIVSGSSPCKELVDTTHFHIDFFGNYLPGLCSGLSIKMEDLGKPLDPLKYPIITALYHEGVAGLVKTAGEHGYSFRDQYLSKCDLCFEIRKYLVLDKHYQSMELKPPGFYEQV